MPEDEGAAAVVVCLAPSGRETARRAAALLGGPLDLGPAAAEGGPPAFEDLGAHLRALFLGGRAVVTVMAAGAAIRCLAPVLGDKRREPPVVALTEDGAHAIPLLGGHRGANALARRLAAGLGAAAAVSTAGDLALGVALDAPPPGWRLAAPEGAKAAAAALLAGRAARLAGGPAHLAPLTAPGADGAPPRAAPAPAPAPGQMTLAVEGAPPARFFETRLALGVGCARGCPPEALAELAAAALAEAGADPAALAAIGSLDLKADEAAVGALARALGRELRLFTAEELERERDRLASPSETVFAEVGCHGVAEGAALALAGPRARLILPKRKNAVATAALAAAPAPILALSGRARGRLAVVGLGPGAADWRTPEASRLIAEAEELVGYGLYLDLLGPAARGKARRAFPLGAERERCAYALERAGEGRSVALISSGDAGIYAMAALVLELLDPDTADGASDAARRAELTIAPGITAMQAAAARAGAPLGHDFCAISLSDLLTPRATILARVRAAAAGDFVIAFYNPVSQRRRTLLAEAREILIAARGGAAPVLLAADLGRPAERLRARSLETLDVDEVDMLTTVLVGARGSRFFATGDHAAGAEGRRLYTPRGYAAKPGGAGGAGDGRTGSEDGA